MKGFELGIWFEKDSNEKRNVAKSFNMAFI